MEGPPVVLGRPLSRLLLVCSPAVVLAGVAAELVKERLGLPMTHEAVAFFSLSYEANLPTWYSSALLLGCALLLAVCAADVRARGERFFAAWCVLAGGFSFLSADEVGGLHEHAGALYRGSGVLYFGWVVPAGVVVLAVGAAYLRFLFHLPRRSRRAFVLAGALYVLGAVVLELPLGLWTERFGADNLGYALIDATEEGLEILGAHLFLLSLLDHLGRRGVTLAFRAGAP